jgi:hypothetical protein
LRDPPHISKITRAKWTGGVAQVVELLLCKHEVLSSNPNPRERERERERESIAIIFGIQT